MEEFVHAGLRFDVRDGGPADGDPVVLLHGFPEDSTSWAKLEPLLHRAGMRTLAPDQRGYSPGARPSGRRDYVIDRLAGDVVALLDAAGLESAHVVGHDWGGVVAWALAGLHPDRIRSVTVLSTPHPAALTKVWFTSNQALRLWYVLAFQFPWLPERSLSQPALTDGLASTGLAAERARHDAARMIEPDALRCALNWYRALPFWLRRMQFRASVPATYIWGRNDTFLGRKAALGTAAFVDADYEFVEVDGDHWLPETHAELIAGHVVRRVLTVAA